MPVFFNKPSNKTPRMRQYGCKLPSIRTLMDIYVRQRKLCER